MKKLICSTVLFTIVVSGLSQNHHESDLPFLMKVGKESLSSSSSPPSGRTQKYRCDMSPEVLFVHDATSSQEQAVKNLRDRLPAFFDMVEEYFGSHISFGFTSFKDKYVAGTSWASSSDYCAKLHRKITLIGSEDRETQLNEIYEEYDSFVPTVEGGNDVLDGINEGILRSAASNRVGWSTVDLDPLTNRPVIRLLIAFTDYPSHPAVHRLRNEQVDLPKNRIADNITILDEDIDAECRTSDFPFGADIGKVLRQRNIVPIMFTGRPDNNKDPKPHGSPTGLVNDLGKYFKSIGKMPGNLDIRNTENGTTNFMKWFFETEVGVAASVIQADDHLTQILDKVKEALSNMETTFCEMAEEIINNHNNKNTTTEKPNTEKPNTEKPNTEKPNTEKPNTEKPPLTENPPPHTENPNNTLLSTEENNGGGNGSNLTSTKPTTIPTTTTSAQVASETEESEEDGGWGTAGLAVGSAAAGLAAVGTAAYMIVQSKFFVAAPTRSNPPRPQLDQDVDNECEPEPREQQEAIRGGLFS